MNATTYLNLPDDVKAFVKGNWHEDASVPDGIIVSNGVAIPVQRFVADQRAAARRAARKRERQNRLRGRRQQR